MLPPIITTTSLLLALILVSLIRHSLPALSPSLSVFSVFYVVLTLTVSNDILAPPEQQVHSIMASTIMSSFKGVEQTAAIAVLTDSHLRAVYLSNPVNQSTSQPVISSRPPSFKPFLLHFPTNLPHF